jgi:hypothetical protein
MDRYYAFPGGLTIKYYPLDVLRIRSESGDSTTEIVLPLNANDPSFIFEEHNVVNYYTFTGRTLDNNQFKLYVMHFINSPWFDDKMRIDLQLNLRGDDGAFDEDNGYKVSGLNRIITSPHDRAFLTRLIEIGRAVRDGTPLPASHNLDGLPNVPVPAPAPAPELRNLPANATNAITYEPIANSTNMVNFHGEFEHGRYYKRNTFTQLPAGPNGRKRNPYTQQNIMNTRSYRARIPQPPEGGRRRKTRRSHKTRRRHQK